METSMCAYTLHLVSAPLRYPHEGWWTPTYWRELLEKLAGNPYQSHGFPASARHDEINSRR